jgi:hypothetical protein
MGGPARTPGRPALTCSTSPYLPRHSGKAAILRFAAPAVLATAALVGVLAPQAQALPAPIPVDTATHVPAGVVPAGAESLVTESVNVEGPLVNNISLPILQ